MPRSKSKKKSDGKSKSGGKSKSKIPGADKFEKIKNDMIRKWINVPMSILVVCTAGACYNLFAYFQQIGAAKKYGSTTMTSIKYTVLFGYYLGLLPGLINRALGDTIALIIAAVMALISFTALGFIVEADNAFAEISMLVFLFTGAMSGGIATIAAIVTPVKSFPKMAGILIIVILIGYYKIAPYFEFSIRSAFFEEPDLKLYFIGVGILQAIIFGIGAFVLKEVDLEAAIEEMIKNYDRMGLLSYVLIEVIFFCAFYIIALIYENWFVGGILFIVVLVLNFLAVGASFYVVYSQARKGGLEALSLNKTKRKEIKFEEMLGTPKYLCLAFSSLLVIGITCTFSFNIFQIAFAVGQIDSADNLLDTFWGADMFGRIGGGLAAYFLVDSINGYLWATGAGACAAFGFLIALLTDPVGGMFLFTATILIAFASGLFWVLVPSIVMEDAGEKNFGLNWGLTLFLSVLGMLMFGEFFDFVYEWQAGNDSGKCSGGNCILLQFIFFAVLGFVAAGLCYFAFTQDDAAGSDGKKDKKDKKDNRKSKDRGRSSNKDSRGKKDGKSKSKDKKSKSKNKSKSKKK